jgi:hypothetical protein
MIKVYANIIGIVPMPNIDKFEQRKNDLQL